MHDVKKAAKPSKTIKNRLPVAKVAIMPQPETPKQADYEKREKMYRAEDALRDIERANKHMADKSLMKDVKVLAKEKMKALGKLC